MSVAPICISRRCKETLPSLRELRLASSRQVSTLGAETKVRAKGQHRLEVLREAVRQAKPAARSGFLEQPVGMHPAHPVGVLAIRGVSVSSISPVPSSGESGELPYCAAGLVPISSNASLNWWPIT